MYNLIYLNPTRVREEFLSMMEWNNSLNYNTRSWFTIDTGEVWGEVNRDYKQQIAKRIDATTPYSRAGISSAVVPFMRFRTQDKVSKQYTYNCSARTSSGLYLPAMPVNVGLKDLALKRVKSKLASSQQEFKALIPIGEVKELRGLVRSTAESSFKLLLEVQALLKGKGSVKSVVSAIGDSWLNYSFAIAPTVSDVKQLAATLSDFALRKDHGIVQHAGSRTDWRTTTTITPSLPTGALCEVKIEGRHLLTYRYTCGMDFKVSSGNNYSLLDALGFRKEDIASAIYELTPYSWLLDYFTTTGDWLEDAFTAPSGNARYVVLNTSYDYYATLSYKVRADAGYNLISSSNTYAGHLEGFRFTREKLSTLPHRTFRFKSVDEIGKNAVNKVMNLASILAVHSIPPGAIAKRWGSNAISR
jgi:hypothetical protein